MDNDSPATAVADVPDDRTPLRRRILGASLVGLAGSLAASFGSRVGATTVPPATATTAPPRQPVADDLAALGFAQRVELAAVELYDAALGGRQTDGAMRPTLLAIREAHQAYAQSLSALLGKGAPDIAEAAIVEQYRSVFMALPGEMLAAAAELENIAVATHTELMGALQGTDGAALVASILTVEARHAVVLLDMAEVRDLDALIVNDAAALTVEG